MRKSVQSAPPEMLAIEGHFADFDQLTAFTAAWDIDFRQVDRGYLNASLSQLVDSSWSLAKARFDRTAHQQGMAIPGMRTFAMLEPHAPENRWCGRSFSADTIAIFAKDGEFQSISKPGFDVYTFSFAEEQLAAACERLGIPDVTEKFSVGGELLHMDPERARVLRRLARSSLQFLCNKDLKNPDRTDRNHLRDRTSEQLVMLLTDGSRLTRTSSQRLRSRTLQRALEVIEAGLERGISVSEVAKASGVCRRTLEYAFRDHFQLSPKTFINSQRLIMVKRDLLSKANGVPIIEVANRWGFWHMGQFASDYRKYFGELPSHTKRT